MPSVSSEIIAEITDHIRKFGGDFTAWCVGTARDWHSPHPCGPPNRRETRRTDLPRGLHPRRRPHRARLLRYPVWNRSRQR